VKAKLIFVLARQPECLILDEPTSGLDPITRKGLPSIIGQLAREHKITTLISSHNLDEITAYATDVGILHHGRLIFSASLDQINHQIAMIQFDNGNAPALDDLPDQIIKSKKHQNTIQWLVWDKNHPDVKKFVSRSNTENILIRSISLQQLQIFLTSVETSDFFQPDMQD
nr:hypothetical protein [Bacteroidota bacterium]